METVARADGLWELDFEFPLAAEGRQKVGQKGEVPRQSSSSQRLVSRIALTDLGVGGETCYLEWPLRQT